MVKTDLCERIHSRLDLTKKESSECLEEVLSILKGTLESGENVKIAGFGVFTVKNKNPRRGRNPQTGESIVLGARRVITFKPSGILKDAINV